MTDGEDWVDIGAVEELSRLSVQRVLARRLPLALSFKDGRFGAVSNVCNHAGGSLGEGALDGDYLVCPWHHWKFQRCSGLGEPGFEDDCVPAFPVKIEAGRLLVNLAAATARNRKPHPPHPLEREPERAPGKLRVAGIATTAMDGSHPRFSGSDHLLQHALDAAAAQGAETRLIALNALKFRACEGYYSNRPRPAPGRARSRRWTKAIRWTASTRPSSIGPTR